MRRRSARTNRRGRCAASRMIYQRDRRQSDLILLTMPSFPLSSHVLDALCFYTSPLGFGFRRRALLSFRCCSRRSCDWSRWQHGRGSRMAVVLRITWYRNATWRYADRWIHVKRLVCVGCNAANMRIFLLERRLRGRRCLLDDGRRRFDETNHLEIGRYFVARERPGCCCSLLVP